MCVWVFEAIYCRMRLDSRPTIAALFFCIRWCDAKIAGVPTRLINFITRTVIGEIWGKLLHVADDVKDGERPNHKEAIESQPEFYQFVQERIASMFQRLKDDQEMNEERRFISYLQS
jgi:hypothetical protein